MKFQKLTYQHLSTCLFFGDAAPDAAQAGSTHLSGYKIYAKGTFNDNVTNIQIYNGSNLLREFTISPTKAVTSITARCVRITACENSNDFFISSGSSGNRSLLYVAYYSYSKNQSKIIYESQSYYNPGDVTSLAPLCSDSYGSYYAFWMRSSPILGFVSSTDSTVYSIKSSSGLDNAYTAQVYKDVFISYGSLSYQNVTFFKISRNSSSSVSLANANISGTYLPGNSYSLQDRNIPSAQIKAGENGTVLSGCVHWTTSYSHYRDILFSVKCTNTSNYAVLTNSNYQITYKLLAITSETSSTSADLNGLPFYYNPSPCLYSNLTNSFQFGVYKSGMASFVGMKDDTILHSSMILKSTLNPNSIFLDTKNTKIMFVNEGCLYEILISPYETSSGSVNIKNYWTCPEDGTYKIILVGAGGDGGKTWSGGSGYLKIGVMNLIKNQKIEYNVGTSLSSVPMVINATFFGDLVAPSALKDKGQFDGATVASSGGAGGYDFVTYGGHGTPQLTTSSSNIMTVMTDRNAGRAAYQGSIQSGAGYGAGGAYNRPGRSGVIIIIR